MPTDLASMVFATTARVSQRATDTSTLLELAQARGVDASVFDTNAPFFWPNEISSNRLDSYYTRMDPLTTLPNFAADAAEGRAFLAGHDNRQLPFGSTLTGTLETTGDVTRVLADAYTLSGLTLGGVNVDSFITGVRGGIIRDVSVGFYGGQWICDICGRDMLADWWDCWHVPGLVYEVTDAGGIQTAVREQLCTALVKNAHLSEVSAVYDGATPGAAIIQAQRAAESGHLSPMQARLLEQRYRINLPGKRIVVPGADIPKENRSMDPEQTEQNAGEQPVVEEVETPVEQPVVETEVETDEQPIATPAEQPASEERSAPAQVLLTADPFAQLRSVLGIAADVDVAGHVRQLMTEAADGRVYRAAQIDAAIAEGVRALGAEFDEESYRAMLQAAPIAAIQRMAQDWGRVASTRFVGGRKIVEQPAPEPVAAPIVPAIPDAAFAG